MVETDWREVLSFSQRELKQADKEKLCESLSWMEADDIELNFTDLKTLFKLAQDILKYKSEQVNNLLGQLETSQKKNSKTKPKTGYIESPTRSTDSVLEEITHQEEVIKSNKEILEQLYIDIAELEGRKRKLQEGGNNFDKDSESSRDALSEMDAIGQLENDITLKNKHIRKLLSDVKVFEEENSNLKEKVTVLKDKLTEATQLIENLTEQLFHMSDECSQLKESLGKSEKAKVNLSLELESLRKELFEKDSNRDNFYEEFKTKVQHWKNIARSKKTEIEALLNENTKLKENLIRTSKPSSTKNNYYEEEKKIKELQDKLSEASTEIMQSANLIKLLKAENKQLRSTIQEIQDISVSDVKNESDDGKEKNNINKLKKKINNLNSALQGAEEMIAIREKELAEISSQLQLIQSDEGINALLEGLKSKKRQLKLKDEGIKSLVYEINKLNQLVDDLQLENETMRQELNIRPDEKISTKGIIKKYHDIQKINKEVTKELNRIENKLVSTEIENRDLNMKVAKLSKLLIDEGCNKNKIDEAYQTEDDDNDVMPTGAGGEEPVIAPKQENKDTQDTRKEDSRPTEMKAIIEENEGLRKGLQEILDFLKDNSTTSSGVLALQCPSLDAVLQSMEARHAAGWFAPHMATVMELRAALGGKDALLTALHEARKETFDVMTQLSKESQRSLELEQKLKEIELMKQPESEVKHNVPNSDIDIGKFGNWVSENEQIRINFSDTNQIENIISKGNALYEDQLKNGLMYFHNKFKYLFDKMTSLTIQAVDDHNKWSILEEQYKAQIENLKIQLTQSENDDVSDNSPGLVDIPSTNALQRKCSYLEESYKYIRTLIENIKNEYLENKKEVMVVISDYETQIQKLILSVTNLTDKLRNTINIELFWKQHDSLNEVTSKYRKLLNDNHKRNDQSYDLIKRLEDNKNDIINTFQKTLPESIVNDSDEGKAILSYMEQSIKHKQMQEICNELENKNKELDTLKIKYTELQESQGKIIDKTLATVPREEIDLMKEQLEMLIKENGILKEQGQHVASQLEIALLQLQDSQQRHMNNDMEINMLRHQILDLQSTGDNKAIVARLSGEVLVAHLQASESNKKIERLMSTLNKEKQMRLELEEMMEARQKIFDVYSSRYESKFRYMYDIMQILRQQYHGCLPLTSIENYLNTVEDLTSKNRAVNEKLSELEDLRSNLIAKHTIYDQILDISKAKCLEEDDSCPHKLKNIVLQGIHTREMEHCNKKIQMLEQSQEEILRYCNRLEKTLVLVNQGFEKTSIENVVNKKVYSNINTNLELQDVHSDDEQSSRRDQTITLPKPQVLTPKNTLKMNNIRKEKPDPLPESPAKAEAVIETRNFANVFVQTSAVEIQKIYKSVQTEEDCVINELKSQINNLKRNNDKKSTELTEAIKLAQQRIEDILVLNTEKINIEAVNQNLKDSSVQKDKMIEKLRITIEELKKQLNTLRSNQIEERNKSKDKANEENKSLLNALKQMEEDKNSIVEEYKILLNNEREEYIKSTKELNVKISELQTQLDRKASDSNASNAEALKEVVNKYTLKIVELEDKCFKLQSDLDNCKTEMATYQSEGDRWKNLASERLNKMEQLNSQLEERHCHEVDSYKAENQHWLSQLNETQREHMELRTRLTEQKALYVKQLADKDAQVEQMRSIINNLKTQIMSMQTMMSLNDPSFDLSAIVEIEEASDMSQHGSDRLELKFDSTVDLRDLQDDIVRMPATSTAIWQEPIIERLRREKQLAGKQNAILRRQIKALAARERRARLDAQNLKNQVFRISTSSSKGATAETVALHNKISSLQAQLTNARRDTHSTIALWDKWKRAQQASERWQVRYEDKCQEVKKIEASLSLAKSAVSRLEREKRVLLTKLSEAKDEKLLTVEKQEAEKSEKSIRSVDEHHSDAEDNIQISSRALLERVQAQQRRIVALELAEKGNEVLVSEYEKALAEITALKGQVLKLESTILESQIRSPLQTTRDTQPELEYWKSYTDMLKQENVQLTLKLNTVQSPPATVHQHRINDLEQTVLTLRGLVSKLQAEQKSSGVQKKIDSRPSSAHSFKDNKGRNQLESYRIEIANLKRSIQDKDLLLERSKEMLKIAAEREDELLKENTFLRRQLDEITKSKGGGFLSV